MNSATFFRSSTGMAFYISSAQIVETKIKEDRWSKADQGWRFIRGRDFTREVRLPLRSARRVDLTPG